VALIVEREAYRRDPRPKRDPRPTITASEGISAILLSEFRITERPQEPKQCPCVRPPSQTRLGIVNVVPDHDV